MTSDRPYRKAIPIDRACQEIADGAGSQFDPAVVEAVTAIVPDLPGLHAALHDGALHDGAVDSLARASQPSATLPLRGAEPGAGPLKGARARDTGARARDTGARAPDAARRS
jgi:hypothetical protein